MYLLDTDIIGVLSKISAQGLTLAGAILLARQLFDYFKDRDTKRFNAHVEVERNKAISIETIKKLELADKIFTDDIKRLEQLIKEQDHDQDEIRKTLEELKEDHKSFIKLTLEYYMQR